MSASPIEFDPYASPIKLINITSPTSEVSIQELITTIRDWIDELANIQHEQIILSSGKEDLGGGVYVGLTMELSDEWRIKFWDGVGVGYIKDGTLVPTSGYGGTPIEPTGGDDTIIVLNQVGGIITVTGSGITPQDKDDIKNLVWNEQSRGIKLDNLEGDIDEVPQKVWAVETRGAKLDNVEGDIDDVPEEVWSEEDRGAKLDEIRAFEAKLDEIKASLTVRKARFEG